MNQDTKLSNVTYTLQRQTAETEEGRVIWRDVSPSTASFVEAESALEDVEEGTYRVIQRNCTYVEIQTFVKTGPAPAPLPVTVFVSDDGKTTLTAADILILDHAMRAEWETFNRE